MNVKLLLKGLFVLTSIFSTHAEDRQSDKDFYAEIASFGQIGEPGRPMDTIAEAVLPPNKQLHWDHTTSHRFTPLKKITTKKEMEDALALLRNEYQPFLRDMTPDYESCRIGMRIDSMQFRYETDLDCLDFKRLTDGEGDWTMVSIPYYHGPQGISTAWYRKEIEISADILQFPTIMLHFNGADYYTDAYVNGYHVGYHEGMLDEFEFNIKRYVHPGKNLFLIKVRNDYSMLGGEGSPRRFGNKLAASNCPGWDDPFSGWTCCPAGYGIYQDVYIEGRSAPYINDIFCRPLLDKSAVELWTEIDLENGNKADSLQLEYSLYGQNFRSIIIDKQRKNIYVEGGRVLVRSLITIPDDQLRLWTPDAPWLYQMRVSLYDRQGKRLLDKRKQQFGMRQFEISETSVPLGRMFLNGEEVRLRGTNTMGFLQKSVMAHDWERLIDDLLLAKLTNMNFIRTTQRIVQKEVYEYADRLGIMMQADLPLFAYINQRQYTEILKQAANIERLIRNHPSVVLMSYLNESMAGMKAHAIGRRAYERLFEALDIVVHNENPERAVKYVDGDYQAPNNGYPDNHSYNILYDEHWITLPALCRGAWMPVKKGWMYGCGEFGAEGMDFVDLMQRRYPEEWLANDKNGEWTPQNMKGIYSGSQTWNKHWDWFETQHTMDDWVEESQKHQAWGVGLVARAFRRMPRMNSFAIHLFIDAWPNGWMKAVMDCERTPKPAWYVYCDALTPLSVQIDGERDTFFGGESYPFRVWICNDTHSSPKATLVYTLEVDGKVVDSGTSEASVPSIKDAVKFQGFLPVVMPVVDKKTVVNVMVGLVDAATGATLHEDNAACTVYPRQNSETDNVRAYLIGSSGCTKEIIESVGLGNVVSHGKIKENDLILIADSVSAFSRKKEIHEAVNRGARAVVLKDAVGLLALSIFEHGKSNVVDTVGSSWIVFRNKNHEWLKNSSSTDLKYTYSSLTNSPERHQFRLFESESVMPVLTYREKTVLGECRQGKGRWIVCSLKLEGKLSTTPVLLELMRNICREEPAQQAEQQQNANICY